MTPIARPISIGAHGGTPNDDGVPSRHLAKRWGVSLAIPRQRSGSAGFASLRVLAMERPAVAGSLATLRLAIQRRGLRLSFGADGVLVGFKSWSDSKSKRAAGGLARNERSRHLRPGLGPHSRHRSGKSRSVNIDRSPICGSPLTGPRFMLRQCPLPGRGPASAKGGDRQTLAARSKADLLSEKAARLRICSESSASLERWEQAASRRWLVSQGFALFARASRFRASVAK